MFDCDWNFDRLSHFVDAFCDQFRRDTKQVKVSFVRGQMTPNIDIDLVVAFTFGDSSALGQP